MRGIAISFLLLLFCTTIQAQSKRTPYHIDARLNLPIIISSGIGVGLTRYFVRDIEPLTATERAALNISDLSGFDQSATERYSTSLTTASDYVHYATLATPLLLLASNEVGRRELGPIFLLSVESVLLTDFFVGLGKVTVDKPRPYMYNVNAELTEQILKDRDHRLSFFSRPTALTATLSFATAQMYSDYHPKSKYKGYVWVAAATVPAVVGYMRYESGQEFPSDIITGYAVGAAVGFLVPYLHKKAKKWLRK